MRVQFVVTVICATLAVTAQNKALTNTSLLAQVDADMMPGAAPVPECKKTPGHLVVPVINVIDASQHEEMEKAPKGDD